ncbi:MAG: SPOR domain-containing protein [Bacteroidales bacterium]|nr:SPOR domain-containing protein [Bacteroidales bacterium]
MAALTSPYIVCIETALPPRLRLSMPVKYFLSILFLTLFLTFPAHLKAQATEEDYEEISVFLAVQGIGGYEITAIYKNDQIYLPISDVFQALKINQRVSEFNDTISGFFLDENNKYNISKPGNTIFINGKQIQLSEEELMNTETTSLALRLDQYGKIFGLDCKFNFSTLTVDLTTKLELPVIKELRLEQMRKNISRLRGDIKVDTTFQRKYHLFRGGMADWAVYSTQITGGTSETRAMLGLGAELFGGETNIELNYSTRSNFDKRQQQYQWRWANNNTKLVKQIIVGKINSKSVASIYSPLIGTVITNTPTTFRRSFGSYTMIDYTEPGWTVELYINNVVVDYTTADAKGFFKFDIPLVYGSSNVKIKYYGPWGEERQKEQIINVPYTFMPKGEMQYTIAGALVQDTSHSIFTRGETNYGVTRHLTLGGGFEYLSSVVAAPSIPFVTGSAQILNNFLLNGEYAYGVRTKALFSYSLPSNFVLDIDYTKYAREQKAITFNYLEERKIKLSVPISIYKFKAYTRFAYMQNILRETNYSTAEATISTYVKGVSANFTGNANWIKEHEPYIYGNLALGFRFFNTLSFRPQVQYDFSNNALIFTKVEIENYFSPKCNLSLVFENNVRNNLNTVELTFRYDLSFVQTSIGTRISKDYIRTDQSARGSFAFGSGNGRVIADTRSKVGTAGLTVVPFLDINNNNRREDDEPITSGMDMRINGGKILTDSKDSIIRIVDLEPFASYMIEFNDSRFENIAWQIKQKTIGILMDPNQFKLLEVPIKVMGEINGTVYMKTTTGLKPQGRIQINIFNENGNLVTKTLSESDGYYNYLGLAPGKYHAEIDSLQLFRLRSVAKPNRFDFEIQPTINGDIIDNIEFVLSKQTAKIQEVAVIEPKKEEVIPVVVEEVIPLVVEEVIPVVVEEVIPAVVEEVKPAVIEEVKPVVVEVVKPAVKDAIIVIPPADIPNETNEDHKFFVQAGAFIKLKNAERLVKDLSKLTSKKWFIEQEDEFFKVRLGYFDSKESANELKESLNTPDISYYISEIPLASIPDQQLKETEIAQHKQAEVQQAEKTEAIAKESVITPSMDCEDSLHPQNGYFLQAGAFAIKSNAEKLVVKLTASTGKNWFIACGKGLYKVRLGYFTTKQEARETEKSLKGTGIAFYVNKPKDIEIKDQAKRLTEIAVLKQKAETVPIPVPDQTKPKTVVPKQEEVKIVKKNEVKPPVNVVVPVAKEEKAEVRTKDGVVIVPPDEANKATEMSKYYIQAGAFESRVHAERLSQDLLGLTLKRWFIVYEDGYYKVRLGYFTTKEAAKAIEATLNVTEVPYYVGGVPVIPSPSPIKNGSDIKNQKQKSEQKVTLPVKNQETKPLAVPEQEKVKPVKPDETKAVKRTAMVETPPNDNSGLHRFFIQANAMSNKAIAERIANDLSNLTRKEWFIVFEDDLYKVRLGYFDSKDEAKYVEGTLNTPGASYYIDEIASGKTEY